MSGLLKKVVLKPAVEIEKIMLPVFDLNFVPFVIGVVVLKEFLSFLFYSESITESCSDPTLFCGYTVSNLRIVFDAIYEALPFILFVYLAFVGVRLRGLRPVAFLPVVGLATFFTLARWLMTDILKVGKNQTDTDNKSPNATPNKSLAQFALNELLYLFSAGNVDIVSVAIGAGAALASI